MTALIVSIVGSLLMPALFVLVDAGARRGGTSTADDPATQLLLGILIALSVIVILAVLVLTVFAFRRDARRGILLSTLAVVVLFTQAAVVAVLLASGG